MAIGSEGSNPAGGADAPRGRAYYALALLTVINLLNYLDRNVIYALFEPIKRDLTLSDAQLGWVGSAYVLVYSVAALPFGAISDLRSRKAVVAGGVALWSLFTVLSGLVTSYPQLFICRAAVGIGEAAFGAAAASLIADYFPGRGRAMALGIFAAGLVLGGGLGIWLGGVLGELYGWRAAFMAAGLPGFLCAALAWRLDDPRVPDAQAFADRLGGTVREIGRGLAFVLRTPTLVYIFVGGALISFGMNGLVGWAPTFVTRELGITPKDASNLLGWRLLVFGALGTLAGGFIADALRRWTRTGRVITVALGMITGGALAVWLLTLRDPAVFKPVFALSVFVLTWYNGPLNAAIFDVVPARISATIAGAYFLFIHLAGDAIALPLVGVLSDRFGIDTAVLLLPTVALLGGIIVAFAIRTVSRDMARVTESEGY